jgi:histidinol-phosphate/aromatic aminotransferase/cobyric acid decarboxylase-like protein
MRTVHDVNLDDLIRLVAQGINVKLSEIVPFADFIDFMTELFNMTCAPTSHLISAGHATPEVEMAADRTGITPIEVFGVSPFATEVEAVLHAVKSTADIIYVANPNRVSGNNFSLKDLTAMARAIPRGYLIVDEHYFEFFGITGLPLLAKFTNVVILRSFTGSFGIASIDSGYAVANRAVADQFRQALTHQRISTTVKKTILAALMNREAMSARLKEVHQESLRLCQELTQLGVQTRLTATDFMLLRVADPRRVGNSLARHKVSIDNLDGYRELNNFLRYRVQSPLTNDRLMDAFKSMPADDYVMSAETRRALVLKRPGEKTDQPDTMPGVDTETVMERRTVYEAEAEEIETAKDTVTQ